MERLHLKKGTQEGGPPREGLRRRQLEIEQLLNRPIGGIEIPPELRAQMVKDPELLKLSEKELNEKINQYLKLWNDWFEVRKEEKEGKEGKPFLALTDSETAYQLVKKAESSNNPQEYLFRMKLLLIELFTILEKWDEDTLAKLANLNSEEINQIIQNPLFYRKLFNLALLVLEPEDTPEDYLGFLFRYVPRSVIEGEKKLGEYSIEDLKKLYPLYKELNKKVQEFPENLRLFLRERAPLILEYALRVSDDERIRERFLEGYLALLEGVDLSTIEKGAHLVLLGLAEGFALSSMNVDEFRNYIPQLLEQIFQRAREQIREQIEEIMAQEPRLVKISEIIEQVSKRILGMLPEGVRRKIGLPSAETPPSETKPPEEEIKPTPPEEVQPPSPPPETPPSETPPQPERERSLEKLIELLSEVMGRCSYLYIKFSSLNFPPYAEGFMLKSARTREGIWSGGLLESIEEITTRKERESPTKAKLRIGLYKTALIVRGLLEDVLRETSEITQKYSGVTPDRVNLEEIENDREKLNQIKRRLDLLEGPIEELKKHFGERRIKRKEDRLNLVKKVLGVVGISAVTGIALTVLIPAAIYGAFLYLTTREIMHNLRGGR